MWSIAERELGNGMRYEELKRHNELGDYTIYPGQILLLPPDGKPEKEDPQERPKYVT
ncbi:MAG: LysM peptidoglycan-binding domain-containing protein, partial [Oscillospiraceae bacterium]|nr:LysM peptidoglycan-binding domain-containing protein [Oscillospiraceae bacterium]